MGFAPAMASRRQRSRKALVSLPNTEPLQTKKRPPEGDRFVEGNRRCLVFDLARVDLAGPRASRRGTVLDELLKALEVVFHAPRRCLYELVADLTGRATRRIVVDGELHHG